MQLKEVVKLIRLLKIGSKGEDVRGLQRKLIKVGYYIGAIDGIFGPATNRAVKAFQSRNTLKVDGIVGPATWAILNNEKTTKSLYYKSGSVDVVELDPLDLKISIQDKAGNKINLSNYVTSGYQWHHSNGATYPLGMLVSEGKVISNTQPHGKPSGTLIVYKDDTVAVKELLSIKNEKNVQFAVGGCSILPDVKMTSAGFVGAYSDIGRSTNRPMIGYNPSKKKIIIAVRSYCNIDKAKQTLRGLGCTIGITLDGGGSTILKVNNKLIRNTTRRLYSVLTWD